MKTRVVIPVATLVAIALAACGSSSGPSLSAFKAGFTTDRAHFRQLGLDLQRAITGAQAKTDAQLATEIGALSIRSRQQASQLAKLDPPARYKADLQELVSGFNAIAADLRQISVAAAKHDAQSATTAIRTLLRDATTVKAGDSALAGALKLSAQS